MSSDRKVVTLYRFFLPIQNIDGGSFHLIFKFGNNPVSKTRRFIRLFLISFPFNQVFGNGFPGIFRYNHGIERIPFAYDIPFLHFLVIFDIYPGSVGNCMG